MPLDGAACIGACAAEQPDLLVVSDPITMLTALEVVRACRGVSPGSRIAVHCDAPEDLGPLGEAGADKVLSRALGPAAVVAEVTALRQTA